MPPGLSIISIAIVSKVVISNVIISIVVHLNYESFMFYNTGPCGGTLTLLPNQKKMRLGRKCFPV
jgi:hypothetical protein